MKDNTSVTWRTLPCSVRGRRYSWPTTLPPSKLGTCGTFECVRKAVDRDIYHIPGLVPLPPSPIE